MPGKIALQLCPDFLGMLEKPETIIGVTGTNGKTTVCNMINDILTENKYDFINNKYGSNIDGGIATTLIQGSTMLGKAKKKLAVLEIDERSANKIYPYITPTYLVCTNLFRDSLMRNAHTEFICDILNKYIPKETIMIENADDLICSHVAEQNKKIYFSIAKLPTDTDHFENITRDIIACPKCNSKIEYEYVRYHHIGKAHCVNCDYKTPEADYILTNLDLKNKKMTVKSNNTEEVYDLISDNIINIYNMLAVTIVLKQLGLKFEQINSSFKSIDNKEYSNLCKVITILLDNAKDAAAVSKDRFVLIEFYIENDNLVFSIENTFKDKVDINKLTTINYSTKGKGRGLGLFIANNIINNTNNIKLDQKIINNNIFSSVLKFTNKN
jgi:UDP-N-acetylmuramyl tripeptide synthase